MARETYETHDELDQTTAKDGLGNALIVLTTAVLIFAFVLIQKGMAERYNAGMLADKAATPAPAPPK